MSPTEAAAPPASIPLAADAAGGAERPVHAAALRRHRGRIEAAAAAPWLHQEVARRMLERLPLIRKPPATVLDWWGRLGGSSAALRDALPAAALCVVEPDAAQRERQVQALRGPWWSPQRWRRPVQVRTDSEPGAGAAGMLWSNMGLHHAADPLRLMQRWREWLAADGFLMFSTLGPGTLATLRALYGEQGWPAPHAEFIDMHDLGDMLVRSGFADPVMDQEVLTLTWPAAPALLDELRQLGGNAHPARHPGCRTPRWRRRLESALASRAGADGRIALEFEVVYGHAFNAAPRLAVAERTVVGLERMRDMLRAGRPGGGPAAGGV